MNKEDSCVWGNDYLYMKIYGGVAKEDSYGWGNDYLYMKIHGGVAKEDSIV